MLTHLTQPTEWRSYHNQRLCDVTSPDAYRMADGLRVLVQNIMAAFAVYRTDTVWTAVHCTCRNYRYYRLLSKRS